MGEATERLALVRQPHVATMSQRTTTPKPRSPRLPRAEDSERETEDRSGRSYKRRNLTRQADGRYPSAEYKRLSREEARSEDPIGLRREMRIAQRRRRLAAGTTGRRRQAVYLLDTLSNGKVGIPGCRETFESDEQFANYLGRDPSQMSHIEVGGQGERSEHDRAYDEILAVGMASLLIPLHLFDLPRLFAYLSTLLDVTTGCLLDRRSDHRLEGLRRVLVQHFFSICNRRILNEEPQIAIGVFGALGAYIAAHDDVSPIEDNELQILREASDSVACHVLCSGRPYAQFVTASVGRLIEESSSAFRDFVPDVNKYLPKCFTSKHFDCEHRDHLRDVSNRLRETYLSGPCPPEPPADWPRLIAPVEGPGTQDGVLWEDRPGTYAAASPRAPSKKPCDPESLQTRDENSSGGRGTRAP